MLSPESGHDLPDDIIKEIFLKLPMKSILRCKSVNKSWFDFIKSNTESDQVSYPALCFNNYSTELRAFFFYVFIYDINDYNDEETSADRLDKGIERWHKLFYIDKPRSRFLKSLPRPLIRFEVPHKLNFVANCNGITCLSNDFRVIMLVNPLLTEEVKTLPNPNFYDEVPKGSRQCRLIGFGFDNTTMDFKIVVVSHPIKIAGGGGNDGRQQSVEVYDLRSNAWRKLGVFPFGRVSDSSGSTFLNGVVHWCAKIRHFGWRILTFNMADELFHHFEFPKGWDDHDGDGSVGKLPALLVLNKGSLALVPYYPYRDKPCSNPYVIWKLMMNNKGIMHTKLYSLTLVNNIRYPVSFLNKHKFVYETTPNRYKGTIVSHKLILYDVLNHLHSVVYVTLCGYTPSLKLGAFSPSSVSINM